MADEATTFKAFAAEVRSSYDILLSKLNAIKTSTDEAKLRRKYAENADDTEANADTLKLLKVIRPETPKNIRALFRTVTKDVYRLREAFRDFPEDMVKPQDLQQLDRIIKDLERHLNARTTELDNLKAGRADKSARVKSSRAKSARKSARRVPSTHLALMDSENNVPETPSHIQIGEALCDPEEKSTPRLVMIPPVISTKHSGQKGQNIAVEDKRSALQTIQRDHSYQRERTWGAFHGQKTLSRKGVEVLKLPAANPTPSLVSSGSQASDSEFNIEPHTNPIVKLKRTDITIPDTDIKKGPSKMVREQTKFQETRKAARLNYRRRDQTMVMPSPRNYSHHNANSHAHNKMQKEFTNLERVDLNSQVGCAGDRRQRTGGVPGGRRPSYLVSRSRSVPDGEIGHRNARLPKSVVGFGRAFQELPPLDSLRRGFSGIHSDPP